MTVYSMREVEDIIAANKVAKESPHNDNLLPCPLCGRKVRIRVRENSLRDKKNDAAIYAVFYVYCGNCLLIAQHKMTPYHAAMQWNRLAKLIRSKIDGND